MAAVELTISEACEILEPPVTPHQLRLLIKALRVQPAGRRHTGHVGHPIYTYSAADLLRLHAALSPWLAERHDVGIP